MKKEEAKPAPAPPAAPAEPAAPAAPAGASSESSSKTETAPDGKQTTTSSSVSNDGRTKTTKHVGPGAGARALAEALGGKQLVLLLL